ncbi:hypothetical protein RJ641_007545 [Dillenia turbinata]|uniref:SLH domain-containing protein n=1 Tax=Dillenia turbinata TaxID=194707 RepID=A0AAN8V8Z9_9MAGN
MASTTTTMTTTWSSNSSQLRLAFNCRKCSSMLVKTRFQTLNQRIRLFSVAQYRPREISRSERVYVVNSWANSDSGVNSWPADASDTSGDEERNRWSKGILGAGVAGAFLLVGVTFAAVSIGKRNTPRYKQQMEPLTTQQEVSLTSDSQNTSEEGADTHNMLKDEESPPEYYSLESKTSMDKDHTSSPIIEEGSNGNNSGNEMEQVSSSELNNKNASNGFDAIENLPNQEDMQYESGSNDILVPSAVIPSPPMPASENMGGSSVSLSIKDSDASLTAGIPGSSTDFDEKRKTFELTNSSIPDANLGDLRISHQEEMHSLIRNEDTNPVLDPTSDSTTHTPGKPSASSTQVGSHLDADLKPQAQPDDVIDVASLSTKEESTFACQFTNGYNNASSNRVFSEPTNSGKSFSAGIPAPSAVSAAVQVLPGKILVPAFVDQVQGQALAALQVLKVIEPDTLPSDLCTRREYARWLVSASGALSRNTFSKVYPAMYIENVTELAFDDITPEDPDFSYIQGLAEAGLISSKLSRCDMSSTVDDKQNLFCFYPESPLSRQDLVSWKMALEKRQLPEADRKTLYQLSGFIDVDKINPDACPALVADLSMGEPGIIALAFGYTRLFQPDKPVTKAQAAIALSTGEASEIVSEELTRIEAESIAENAVAAHSALVAQVEKDVNASFEKELLLEREKIDALEKLTDETTRELERLRAEREEQNMALLRERAIVESEMEVLSRLRNEVEEQLQSLMSNKVEISYEKERITKLRKEAEDENQVIAHLQYELEVERKALSMARAWAEDEAKRAREQAKALEEARDHFERHGIKVVVDSDLQEESSADLTWVNAGNTSINGTVTRAENLVEKLKAMGADLAGKSRDVIDKIVNYILFLIHNLKEWVSNACVKGNELKDYGISKVGQNTAELGLTLKEGAKRVVGDCREGVEKLTQRFKT